MSTPQFHTCPICRHTWPYGQSGEHDCTVFLLTQLALYKKATDFVFPKDIDWGKLRNDEIAKLVWRPVRVKPTKEDASASGMVQLLNYNKRKTSQFHWRNWRVLNTHIWRWWRPMSPHVVKDEERDKLDAYKAADKALGETTEDEEEEIRIANLESNYKAAMETVENQRERLAQLEWRSVEVKPTKEDADAGGFVQVSCIATKRAKLHHWNDWAKVDAGYWDMWRPLALPVVKDEEQERFNAWYDARCADPSQHKTQLREAMYDAWQAARKEDKP